MYGFPDPNPHHRQCHQLDGQVLKKLLGHMRILERLFGLFVQFLTEADLDRERQQSTLKRLFAFVLVLLSVPDAASSMRKEETRFNHNIEYL